jgi:two-component system, OmpR family, response regulator
LARELLYPLGGCAPRSAGYRSGERKEKCDRLPLRVLIVDDNQDHADSLAILVELWGHTPNVAYNGESGLRAAAEWRPDCLILDIGMPKLDGYAVAERVRQHPGLERGQLVALSAYSHADHIRRVTEAGFDFRLTKSAEPADLEQLLTMIENILKLAERTEELSRKNVAAAERTEQLAQKNVELAGETRELLQEVKEELKEVKKDVQEIKEDVREVKDQVEKDRTERPSDGPNPTP